MAIMAGITGSAAPGRAIALAVAGGLCLTASDTGMKWLSDQLAPGQIMFIRGGFGALAILLWCMVARTPERLKPKNLTLHTIRGLISAVATFAFILGLPHMSLATAVAILFASPILLTAMAPLVIGEAVGWRRWAAVVAGFIGILIIVRPGLDGFHWAALLVLVAALGEALRDVITRGVSGRETTHSMLFTSMGAACLAGLLVPPYDWITMTGQQWLVILSTGAIWTLAHFLLIEAFRFGEAALLAPFKYCNMAFAVVLGFLVWGDLPDALTWVGSAVIIASGLYILHREVLRRAPVTAQDLVQDDPLLNKATPPE